MLIRGVGTVSVRETLLEELEAHGVRIEDASVASIDGPDVDLQPRDAQALGLAFHELATNAGKYGAFRVDGARLDVSWQLEDGRSGPDVVIEWRETGVPIVGKPERRGFGSETIERHLPYMLDGESALAFEADGLSCTLRFPYRKEDLQ